jgi:hypothetical protein
MNELLNDLISKEVGVAPIGWNEAFDLVEPGRSLSPD